MEEYYLRRVHKWMKLLDSGVLNENEASNVTVDELICMHTHVETETMRILDAVPSPILEKVHQRLVDLAGSGDPRWQHVRGMAESLLKKRKGENGERSAQL